MFVRLFFFVALILLAPATQAHEPFEITTNVRILENGTTLNVLITDSTAAQLCLVGSNVTNKLHREQFTANHLQVERCAAQLYEVRDEKGLLKPRAVQVHLTEEDDLDATITYPPGTGDVLQFTAVHLTRLAEPTYGATFTATSEKHFLGQKLLRADDNTMLVKRHSAAVATYSGFVDFLRLGIAHILTGYDHLLFLAGLLIVCRRLHTALLIITTFTLAHSITLALAGLGLLTLPSRIVEPVIAATIIFVGIENLLRARHGREPSGRWMLTFVFGLLHGFGFASALQEAGMPQGGWGIVASLFSFNLGIELGQLVVAACFLPLLFWLRHFPVFARCIVPIASFGVSFAGIYWFLQRTVFS